MGCEAVQNTRNGYATHDAAPIVDAGFRAVEVLRFEFRSFSENLGGEGDGDGRFGIGTMGQPASIGRGAAAHRSCSVAARSSDHTRYPRHDALPVG